MQRLRDTLRSGDWLTRERLRLWGFAILAASAAGLVYLAATSNGVTDYLGRPLGTDFSCFYAAGTLVLDGHPALAFDPAALYARQQALFGPATPYYGWLYPPFFLGIAAALALLPYPVALATWLAATLPLYLLAIWAIVNGAISPPPAWQASPFSLWGGSNRRQAVRGGADPASPSHPPARAGHDRLWLLLALAFPAVFVNLGHGQNGFLTAALIGGALMQLDRRPILAGVLFGLLVYKPQFGLMIPLALLVTGRWRVILAAAVTVAVLVAATLAAFGPDIWRAYQASTVVARVELLEAGVAGWHKLHSVFAWVRMWGGSTPLAYALHGIVLVLVAAALVRLWRGETRYPLKAAGLVLATLLAAPHSHDYDLMVLAPAIAWLIMDGFACGFGRYEKTILALAGLAPLVTRAVAEHTMVPLGIISTIVLMLVVLVRAGLLRRSSRVAAAPVL